MQSVGVGDGWVADIASRADNERFISEAAGRFGPLTALINNALDTELGGFLDLSEEVFRRSLDSSLVGYFLCGQAAARRMVALGYGRIINVSSGAADRGIQGTAGYAAAKGGVNALTRVMALELAPAGVCVNTLVLGRVPSELWERLKIRGEARDARLRTIPVGRFGDIEDILPMVRYLLSPECAWTTGATFYVDGGSNSAMSGIPLPTGDTDG
jgi:NAD(P)-dependent dehydrogenase (short-subunit alcohol dehydrogenase family)